MLINELSVIEVFENDIQMNKAKIRKIALMDEQLMENGFLFKDKIYIINIIQNEKITIETLEVENFEDDGFCVYVEEAKRVKVKLSKIVIKELESLMIDLVDLEITF